MAAAPGNTNEFIKSKRRVTAEAALNLAAELKTSAEVWMTLQMQFDLRRAELQRKTVV